MALAPSRPVPKRVTAPTPAKPPAEDGHFVRHKAAGYHAGAPATNVVNPKNGSSPGRSS